MMIENKEHHRFEREEHGALVFARHSWGQDVLVIRHVEAEPVLRGTGAADRLMRDILALAQQRQNKIVPLCSYAASWLRRHAPDMIAQG